MCYRVDIAPASSLCPAGLAINDLASRKGLRPGSLRHTIIFSCNDALLMRPSECSSRHRRRRPTQRPSPHPLSYSPHPLLPAETASIGWHVIGFMFTEICSPICPDKGGVIKIWGSLLSIRKRPGVEKIERMRRHVTLETPTYPGGRGPHELGLTV